MKRIVKPIDDNTVSINLITDQSRVGLLMGGEKYLIVSKRYNDRIVYSRMNDNSFIVAEEYKSIKYMVEFLTMAEAFLFENQKEAFTWLLE